MTARAQEAPRDREPRRGGTGRPVLFPSPSPRTGRPSAQHPPQEPKNEAAKGGRGGLPNQRGLEALRQKTTRFLSFPSYGFLLGKFCPQLQFQTGQFIRF